MRIFLLVLILIFSLQSWTKADDIRDFEIEGMSVGDSLLNHFSKKEIKQNLMLDYYQNLPKNFRNIYVISEFKKLKRFKTYTNCFNRFLKKTKNLLFKQLAVYYLSKIKKSVTKNKIK